jgi:hypothetical protein
MEIDINHNTNPEISLDVNMGHLVKIKFNFFHNTVKVMETLGNAIFKSSSQYCLIESVFSEPMPEKLKKINNAQLTIRYRNIFGLSDKDLSHVFLSFYMDHVLKKLSVR